MSINHLTGGSDQDSVQEVAAPRRLHGNLGPLALLLMVLAYNGPLSGVVGWLPVVIGYGNGLGAPVAYAFGALLMALFAAGFMKMSSRIEQPGGFYSFITAGLGRDVGLGAALVALLVYYAILVSSIAYMGLAMKSLVEETLGGPSIHWAVYGVGTLVVVGILGYFRLELSAKILGVLLVAELAVVAVYDASVVWQGGAEGLTATFLDPDVFLSGSVGVGLLFAATTFSGFEATVVFRHEVRDPNRTIPRATYGFLLVVGVFLAFSAWAITQALGASQAVALTQADPTGSVFASAKLFMGVFGLDAVTVLLCTSIFAAILSMHNVLTRYLFNLAGDGVLPRSLAAVHPSQDSPYRASVLTSVVAVLGVAVFVVLGSDVSVLYAQIAGVFCYGLLLLILVTDVAVIVYLNRTRPDGARMWHRVIAPLLAFIGLLTVVVLGTMNIDLLLGSSKAAGLWLCFGVYVLWALGALYARMLKSRKPDIYATIGRQ